jgi:UDP-glucose 6-dehydrogenase
MKKLIILILISTLLLSGCSIVGFDTYFNAQDKTEATSKLSTKINVTIKNNIPEITQDKDMEKYNYFKEIVYEGTFNDDKENNLMVGKNYVSLGGIGFDFDIYAFDENVFIKYPTTEKYMDVKNMETGSLGMSFNEDQFEMLGTNWENIFNEDSFSKGKSTIITVDGKDLKVTEVIFKPDTDLVNEALKNTITEFYTNEYTEAIAYFVDIEKSDFRAYIDQDGYLVKELYHIEYSFNDMEPSIVVIQIDNFNFNKLEIEKPIITEDMIMTKEEMNTSMPSFFEDLLK